MNSRQRRRDRRLWKYRVVTATPHFQDYEDRWRWLDDLHGRNVNKCGWRDRDQGQGPPFETTWEFVNERDAIEFALRWA